MANRSKPPTGATAPSVKPVAESYVPGDALPLPEVIEKDSDSVWALWTDAVKGVPEREPETQPATLLMGLPELPKDHEA